MEPLGTLAELQLECLQPVPLTSAFSAIVTNNSIPELKELKGSMTTPEMAKEIEELKKDCANYTEKLERIKSAANHVTPEEKEKVTKLLRVTKAPMAENGMVQAADSGCPAILYQLYIRAVEVQEYFKIK